MVLHFFKKQTLFPPTLHKVEGAEWLPHPIQGMASFGWLGEWSPGMTFFKTSFWAQWKCCTSTVAELTSPWSYSAFYDGVSEIITHPKCHLAGWKALQKCKVVHSGTTAYVTQKPRDNPRRKRQSEFRIALLYRYCRTRSLSIAQTSLDSHLCKSLHRYKGIDKKAVLK